jgi:hypothetical protein
VQKDIPMSKLVLCARCVRPCLDNPTGFCVRCQIQRANFAIPEQKAAMLQRYDTLEYMRELQMPAGAPWVKVRERPHPEAPGWLEYTISTPLVYSLDAEAVVTSTLAVPDQQPPTWPSDLRNYSVEHFGIAVEPEPWPPRGTSFRIRDDRTGRWFAAMVSFVDTARREGADSWLEVRWSPDGALDQTLLRTNTARVSTTEMKAAWQGMRLVGRNIERRGRRSDLVANERALAAKAINYREQGYSWKRIEATLSTPARTLQRWIAKLRMSN